MPKKTTTKKPAATKKPAKVPTKKKKGPDLLLRVRNYTAELNRNGRHKMRERDTPSAIEIARWKSKTIALEREVAGISILYTRALGELQQMARFI